MAVATCHGAHACRAVCAIVCHLFENGALLLIVISDTSLIHFSRLDTFHILSDLRGRFVVFFRALAFSTLRGIFLRLSFDVMERITERFTIRQHVEACLVTF